MRVTQWSPVKKEDIAYLANFEKNEQLKFKIKIKGFEFTGFSPKQKKVLLK